MEFRPIRGYRTVAGQSELWSDPLDRGKKGVYSSYTHTINDSTPLDTLKYLMEEHNLKQSDLTEIGSQGVVSEILAGKRTLNIEQIKKISYKFNVSPLVFI